jgi:hypothetical protein
MIILRIFNPMKEKTCYYFPTEPVKFVATSHFDDGQSTGMCDIFLSVKGLRHQATLEESEKEMITVSDIIPLTHSNYSIGYDGDKYSLEEVDTLLTLII